MAQARLNKTQIWTKVQEILEGSKVTKAKMAELEELLAPKTGGTSIPTTMIDGVEHAYCRFTSKYWPLEEMVYQNDEKRAEKKHKGYSKVGISLWTKGQKALKDTQKQAIEAIQEGDIERAKRLAKHGQEVNANDYGYLAQFADEDQAQLIDNAPSPSA